MVRRRYSELLILDMKEETNPRGRGYLPKEEAYEQLKYRTGQDFGDDVAAWEKWVNDHPFSTHGSDEVDRRLKSSPLLKKLNQIIDEADCES